MTGIVPKTLDMPDYQTDASSSFLETRVVAFAQ